MNYELIVKLVRYNDIKGMIKALKKEEEDLNAEIVALIPAAPGKETGTSTSAIEDMQVKIVRKYNYKFDVDELSSISADLSDEELACIKYEPKLKAKEYKNCDHSTLDMALIVTPAKPTISIEYVELDFPE